MDIDDRCPLSGDDLRRYAAEHLAHEIRMFRTTAALLAGPAPASLGEWATETALIESLLMHSRVLLNILYPGPVHREDIIANDFVPGPPSWTVVVPRLSPVLSDLRRTNRALPGLTTRRLSRRPVQRTHALSIFAEVDAVLRLFARHATDDRLGADLRKLIRSSTTERRLMRPVPERPPGTPRGAILFEAAARVPARRSRTAAAPAPGAMPRTGQR